MILMDPFLLITLHFSQIGLTDDLTFMCVPPSARFPPALPRGLQGVHIDSCTHAIV